MPEAQLTESLDHAAEKGGVKELFTGLEAAVEADVKAFLSQGNVNAQDFEAGPESADAESAPVEAGSAQERGAIRLHLEPVAAEIDAGNVDRAVVAWSQLLPDTTRVRLRAGRAAEDDKLADQGERQDTHRSRFHHDVPSGNGN